MIDFPLNLHDDIEGWTWFEGSQWLSLDRFERFWPDVGLTLSNGEAVKAAVRHVVRVRYAIDPADRARWAADTPDDVRDTDSPEELAKACFRLMNETAGTQDTECVAAWLTGPVLAVNKEAEWHNAWTGLLYYLAEDEPDTLATAYRIPSDTAQRLVEIARSYRTELDARDERIAAAEQEPLSDWDAIAYADSQTDDSEAKPLSGLWLLLQYLCFDRAWTEVVRCTRPADIDALIRWGNTFLEARDRPNDAAIPDDVRAPWADLHAPPV
jgi:hypothetical protein